MRLLDEPCGFLVIEKMLKGKRCFDPDEMKRNFMGQVGLSGSPGLFFARMRESLRAVNQSRAAHDVKALCSIAERRLDLSWRASGLPSVIFTP